MKTISNLGNILRTALYEKETSLYTFEMFQEKTGCVLDSNWQQAMLMVT